MRHIAKFYDIVPKEGGEEKFLKKLEERYPELQKPFFSKYLPVEGEDKYKGHPCEDGARCFAHRSHPCDQCGRLGGKRVKLFLCSRDIAVGDKATNSEGEEYIFKTQEQINKTLTGTDKNFSWFKVIGEISPEAKWVKEGDEWEENQIQQVKALDSKWTPDPRLGMDILQLRPQIIVHYEIKCPTCGHFH